MLRVLAAITDLSAATVGDATFPAAEVKTETVDQDNTYTIAVWQVPVYWSDLGAGLKAAIRVRLEDIVRASAAQLATVPVEDGGTEGTTLADGSPVALSGQTMQFVWV